MNLPAWLSDHAPFGGADDELTFTAAAEEAAAALESTVVAPLLHLGAIRAGGVDAAGFLQNQLSNDLRRLQTAAAQLSSYNSPKGRVLDLFVVRREQDGFILETRRDTLPATLKRLRLFVLRSKLKLEEVPGYTALGLAGPAAAAMLKQAQLPVPAQDWDCVESGGAVVMCRPGPAGRYTIHAAADAMPGLWQQLSAQARPVGTAAWRLLDVLAGLPSIRPQTADHFVAQMLNLDRLGAISFDKGCYPGQEIVARMHYLGNLKRRMFLCHSRAPAAPGFLVYTAEGDGQAVGEVVDAVPHPRHGTALLAVLQIGQAGAVLRLNHPEGAALEVMDAAEQA